MLWNKRLGAPPPPLVPTSATRMSTTGERSSLIRSIFHVHTKQPVPTGLDVRKRSIIGQPLKRKAKSAECYVHVHQGLQIIFEFNSCTLYNSFRKMRIGSRMITDIQAKPFRRNYHFGSPAPLRRPLSATQDSWHRGCCGENLSASSRQEMLEILPSWYEKCVGASCVRGRERVQ